MDIDKLSWKIIDKYFNDNPNNLVAHHLESYNEFFNNGINRIFRENNPIRFIEREDETDNNQVKRNDSEFNDSEIEDILKKLVKENISHVKKWDSNFDINRLPSQCAVIEIKNNNVNIIKYNSIGDNCDIYHVRLLPFINYLKTIDSININVKFIVMVCDNFEITKINKTPNFDIPILCSSLSNNCRKMYNNSVLIPNLYYYNNWIPIDEIKTHDLEYKNKKKAMNFSGGWSNDTRLAYFIWRSKKNTNEIVGNLLPSFGFKKKGYEKYFNENRVSFKEQLQYKFQVSMDGCSTSWDGLIWKMYSNSLVLKLNQKYHEYWYSLLNKTNIFQCNTFDEMYHIMKTIDENSNEVKEMHRNKKKLAKLLMNDDFNKKYLRGILLELTKIQNMDREITNTYDTQYGKITLYSNEIYIGEKFENGNYWDEDTLCKMKEYIDPTRNILEIGGHCGTSTIIYSSFLDEDKKIFVYEPQKKMYELLVENINQNNLQNKIIPYNLGVFCYSGEGIMNDIDIDGGGGVVDKRYNEEHYFDCNFGGIGLCEFLVIWRHNNK